MIPTLPVGPSINDRVHQARRALRFAVAVDFHGRQVQRIEAHLDAFAGQLRRRFKEAIAQPEGGVAADQPVDAMKEQTAHVRGGRKLPDLLDVTLPAQERRGLPRAVLAAVIDGVEPGPEPLVQLLDGQPRLGIERGKKLLAHGTEEAFDLAASFGRIGRRVNAAGADGGGDARQWRRAGDLGVVHVEARGNTARGEGLAQAIETRVQPAIGIELGVRDEAAGVVERGLQEHLHFAGVPSGSGALNQGPNSMSDCQVWWANSASYFWCAVALPSSSWRWVSPRARRKR